MIEIRKVVLVLEYLHTLDSMGSLASTYRDQGRWTDAEKLEARAMETRKTVLRPDIHGAA
jgi:Tetratricopeptide repeat